MIKLYNGSCFEKIDALIAKSVVIFTSLGIK